MVGKWEVERYAGGGGKELSDGHAEVSSTVGRQPRIETIEKD